MAMWKAGECWRGNGSVEMVMSAQPAAMCARGRNGAGGEAGANVRAKSR
jgi:hypothetical protein